MSAAISERAAVDPHARLEIGTNRFSIDLDHVPVVTLWCCSRIRTPFRWQIERRFTAILCHGQFEASGLKLFDLVEIEKAFERSLEPPDGIQIKFGQTKEPPGLGLA